MSKSIELAARALSVRARIEDMECMDSEEMECAFYERGLMTGIIELLQKDGLTAAGIDIAAEFIANNEEWLSREEREADNG